MALTIALGLCGVLFATLRPLRLAFKSSFAGLGSKIYASTFFCLAGVAAAAQREYLNWQAAALLFGFCMACLGDILLAMEPVLANPERDKNYVFVFGALAFFLAHVITLVVLLSCGTFNPWMLPLLLPLPVLYAVLWRRGTLDFGKLAAPLLLYSLLLGAMVFAAAQTQGMLRWVSLAVACLFALSDTALFLFNFGPKKKSAGGHAFTLLVMLPYYLAQTLLACIVVII